MLNNHLQTSVPLVIFFFHSHNCWRLLCFWFELLWLSWTYVWNEVGICFSVSRGRCVSSPTPNAHLASATDQKAPAGLGQLVNKPLLSISGFCVLDWGNMWTGRGCGFKTAIYCSVYIHMFLIVSVEKCWNVFLLKSHLVYFKCGWSRIGYFSVASLHHFTVLDGLHKQQTSIGGVQMRTAFVCSMHYITCL